MPKVLVVDDSAVMRKIIKKNIAESGMTVDEFVDAGDGKQALEAVSNNNEPVGTTSMAIIFFEPSFIIAPFPNSFSIDKIEASSALNLSGVSFVIFSLRFIKLVWLLCKEIIIDTRKPRQFYFLQNVLLSINNFIEQILYLFLKNILRFY